MMQKGKSFLIHKKQFFLEKLSGWLEREEISEPKGVPKLKWKFQV